ncbi:noncanonical pyrimidine nucleotidase, YjjG family [Romboutsia sp. CE17]|uniref:YjjG family noncanonical pyrimidine nucleotidase n=1 Tax=Romboutsia sp. CE17 TaxID=2724150 RepID=UPI001442E24F|nr:YjjG family noncanonical pyrimidine nucleotidase [Romboutsia sp. CE17]QJA08369.1 noncanonical pyrimidine nucleotidase, YjjG family [Romboutsia sp. CE17]
MKYEVLFFDADDTLFDFKKSENFALDKLMSSIDTDLEKSYCIEIYKEINNNIWKEFEQNLISSDELKIERFKRFADKINLSQDPKILSNMYVNFLAEASFIYKETEELLSYLYKKYKIVIITNGLTSVQNKRIKKSIIKDYFDAVIISDEIKIAKPDPKIFDYALNVINHTNKESVLMIGDSLSSDVKGGVNAGIDTCWFNPNNKKNNSSLIPKYEISTLLELKNIL